MATRTHIPPPVLDALRRRLQCLDGNARRRAVLPFGVPEIDVRLPGGGLALGALHEVAGSGNGATDGAAALFAAGIAARTRGRVLWCVTRQDLFAPALAQAGLEPDRVIYIEAGDEKTLLACCEEGLRHGQRESGVGAVIAEVAQLSMTASRRLQLAAEGSGAIGIVIRRLPALRMRGGGTGAKLKFGAVTGGLLPRLRGRDEEGGGPQALSLPTGPLPSPPPQAGEGTGPDSGEVWGEQRPPDYLANPTAAVTRWRVSALPSAPLPVAGVGRARWRLDLVRCRGGEAACFDVEACDAQGRLALPADVAHGPGQEAPRQRRAAR